MPPKRVTKARVKRLVQEFQKTTRRLREQVHLYDAEFQSVLGPDAYEHFIGAISAERPKEVVETVPRVMVAPKTDKGSIVFCCAAILVLIFLLSLLAPSRLNDFRGILP